MIHLVLWSTIIFSSALFAGEGLVIVYEAPLLERPNDQSPQIGKIPKGQIIYIHRKHFNPEKQIEDFALTDPYYHPRPTRFVPSDQETLDDEKIFNQNVTNSHAFYQTTDNQGKTAYIKKSYVKLITKDGREEFTNVRPYYLDPTDYRIEEPIPDTYPLYTPQQIRAFIAYGLPIESYSSYGYPYSSVSKNSDRPSEWTLMLGKRGTVNEFDLIYIGLMAFQQTKKREITFSNQSRSEEKELKIALGPYFSYDFYYTKKNRFTSFLSILYFLKHELTMKIEPEIAQSTYRSYRGHTFFPRLGFIYQRTKIRSFLDFLVGTSFDIIPPHQLESAQIYHESSTWGYQGRSIQEGWKTGLQLFCGLQIFY